MKNHPDTLRIVMNIGVYKHTEDSGKAEELYERVLEGFEAQLGKDHRHTKHCAKYFKICLEASGKDQERLNVLKEAYPTESES